MMRIGVLLMAAAMASSCCAQDRKPMPASANPVFEVATIRPSDPADHSNGFQTRGRHIKARNKSVTNIVMFAYGLHPKQIVDGPSWMSEHFDIDGVPDAEGEPNLRQMQSMFQKLLADRFGLAFHREKRELTHYAVVQLKTGAKIETSKSDPDQMPDSTGNGGGAFQLMKFTNNTLNDFALSMQYFLDKPVVNETGLEGHFDFTLKWNPKQDPGIDSEFPGLFTAMQEQIGLKCEVVKGPVEVMVVEKLTRPSEN